MVVVLGGGSSVVVVPFPLVLFGCCARRPAGVRMYCSSAARPALSCSEEQDYSSSNQEDNTMLSSDLLLCWIRYNFALLFFVQPRTAHSAAMRAFFLL